MEGEAILGCELTHCCPTILPEIPTFGGRGGVSGVAVSRELGKSNFEGRMEHTTGTSVVMRRVEV